MRATLLAVSFFVFTSPIFSQVSVNIGYNLGHNTYIESKQANLSTEFNIGWDFDSTMPGYTLGFFPNGSAYSVLDPIEWDRSTRGWHVGLGFNEEEDISYELNFVGCTNKSSGSRINLTTNVEEELTLKTKFGTIQFLFCPNITSRLSVNLGIGTSTFKAFYSWTGATSIKNQMFGLRSRPLSGDIKVGDRDLTLSFPVGLTAKVISLEESGLSLKVRAMHTLVWNKMVQTDLIDFLPFSYNLNNTALSIILSKSF